MNEIIDQMKPKMQKACQSLLHEFNKIRTGRANPNILDDIKIDYYGNQTPINQTSNISVEEGRTLAISPWDKSLIKEIIYYLEIHTIRGFFNNALIIKSITVFRI